ncbi:MAG: dihydrofolate reductase [Bacteroidales bacterium]|nr:dihydrofolate reductase [Bacteroidales bacterium]
MKLSIIVAIANKSVIGKDNRLIWHLPADLRYFKNLTMGYPIIMGRKTYESIGRPLPGRTSVIITHNMNFHAEGCIIVHSLEEAIKQVAAFEEAFIIGGAQIYAQALPIADKLYLTRVFHTFDGDTFFPEIMEKEWQLIEETQMNADEKNNYPFAFMVYERVKTNQ